MTADPQADPRPERGGAYDYRGTVRPDYAPERDGDPDPGEVVWGWVPYEEDPTVGKDRPLVIVGHAVDAEGDFVALMLSSKDRSGQEGWLSIGAGGWDGEARESWARVNRPLAISPGAVRREGATLAPEQFLAVAESALGGGRR